MFSRRSAIFFALAAQIWVAGGCSSSDQRAADAAMRADALQTQGQYQGAIVLAQRAVSLDDTNADYWLLLARIQVAARAYDGAYVSYQRVLELDRGSVEALTLLTQMAVLTRQPDKADGYADQLLVLQPDDLTGLVWKGRAALLRGDDDAAMVLANRVLALNPSDLGATMLRARALIAQDKWNDGIALLEKSFALGGPPEERLLLLRDLYRRQWNIVGYERTLARLARVSQADVDIQLDYADMLYQNGSASGARDTLFHLMRAHPRDATLAASIADLWQRQGPTALEASRIVEQAAPMSLQMQSTFAQFANFIGRPDLAKATLPGDIAAAQPNSDNADAKAAYADALRLMGRLRPAKAVIASLLDFDKGHPRALIVRAKIYAQSAATDLAIADARHAVSVDPNSASPRLLLAHLLFASGQDVLAENTLRTAVDALPREPRLAEALAGRLKARGSVEEAAETLRDLVRNAPVDKRAINLRTAWCKQLPHSACDTPADHTLGPSVSGDR